MKELVEPWPHWHSSLNALELSDDHPLCDDPLFGDKNTRVWYFGLADQIATMINKGTRNW